MAPGQRRTGGSSVRLTSVLAGSEKAMELTRTAGRETSMGVGVGVPGDAVRVAASSELALRAEQGWVVQVPASRKRGGWPRGMRQVRPGRRERSGSRVQRPRPEMGSSAVAGMGMRVGWPCS